jgi:hypothetical protein
VVRFLLPLVSNHFGYKMGKLFLAEA